ncbi:hypothetical protein Bca52824_052581 [Brassica carinata]|uniref:F-box domain-containing protein n=1 Tax=Brassica carinata TaxID=52824 RepID=A0A8X7UMF7_BRACI|nr:hypothetical protein Bca52824_052581 [Brassica carinata]
MDAFDAIPNHVVIDILNKVADVKTLIRCRSVSKRFNSLAAQSDSLLLQLDQIFAAAESEPELKDFPVGGDWWWVLRKATRVLGSSSFDAWIVSGEWKAPA